VLQVDPVTGACSDPRVFAAGDATGEGWTVIAAIAQGKRAAFGIDNLLSEGRAEPLVHHELNELGDQARYHPPAVPSASRIAAGERGAAERSGDFVSYLDALAPEQARAEASRCLSCGACARCSNCIDNFGCPAIFQRDGQVVIDEVLCVGCGVCAQLCPNDAITPVRPPADGQP
jgi:ferredoxin